MARYVITLLLFSAALCLGQDWKDVNAKVHDITINLKNPANGIAQYAMPEVSVEVSQSKEVNAYALIEQRKVIVTMPLVQILYRDDGELAFVIAHEIGHIQDANCALRAARAGMSGSRVLRFCESSADNIGMQYLLAAGYSPFDAAGVMGKLLMAYPMQNSVLGIVAGRFLSDHPVDNDRIKQLAEYALQACRERAEMCSH